FPPGRKVKGAGRLVSILHPIEENPSCTMRSSNPAELLIMGANPTGHRTNALTTFDKHQIAIAKKTLKMSDMGARIMGGMTKDEAREVLRRHGLRIVENPKLDSFTKRHLKTWLQSTVH